jgi:hypothetical protein
VFYGACRAVLDAQTPAGTLGGKQEERMAPAEPYRLEFYKEAPGDIGINDCFFQRVQGVEATAEKMLLDFVNKTVSSSQRPRYARLVSGDYMRIIFVLEAIGTDKVQRVS